MGGGSSYPWRNEEYSQPVVGAFVLWAYTPNAYIKP